LLARPQGKGDHIATDGQQKRSTLTILLAAGEVTLRAFRADELDLDAELVADLERMIERLRAELDAVEMDRRGI